MFTCSGSITLTVRAQTVWFTPLPGQKIPRIHTEQGRRLLAERGSQPALSCPLLGTFLRLTELDGSDCTNLLWITVPHKSSSGLSTRPCEVMEMSFDLWKTVAVTVLESRHCIGGWFWRIPRKKGHLGRATGWLIYLPASHGPQAVIKAGPAALVALACWHSWEY